MTPSPSRRTTPLPKNWDTPGGIRETVLDRDGWVCQIQGPKCVGHANEVDHKGDSDDHRLEVLQAACSPCHASKTGKQARARQPNRRRPPEPHPGIVTQRS